MKTPVGVVGVGSLGRHHARIYSELESAELVGVADVNEARAKEIAERFGCAWYRDYRELSEYCQAVSIAAPTHVHAETGTFFLDRRVHVLVEKPIAASIRDADLMIDAAAKNGSVLHVGHTERFNPVFTAIRPYITTPQFFEAHRLGVFVKRSLDVDVVLDLMIHDLDIVTSIVDSPIAEIRAVGVPVLTGKIDIANARIEFEDGCVANITASRVSKDRIRKLRFFQPNDYVSLDFHGQTVEMYSLVRKGPIPDIVEQKPEVLPVEPLKEELKVFLGEVQGQSDERACYGQAGRRALKVALEINEQISR